MTDFGQTFDENNAVENEFAPVPDGWYEVTVDGAEIKDNGSGWRGLSLKLQILSGDCAGRSVFHNITLKSDSEMATKIGAQQMTSLRRSLGIESLSSTDQLLNGFLSAKVGRQKNDPERNEVKAWKPMGDAPAPKPAGKPKASF